MSQTRKAPTPIRTAPSSAPLESMVAKQQAHIDELVARNRTLEHTINKLRAETASEKQQYENALVEANKLWKIERSEWQDGCDTLQRLWRIAHYRTLVELEKARAATLNVKEELRMEKIARLQRDFQIAMFQKKESESEYRISCLEDELVAARLGSDELTERMKQEAGEVSTKYANLKKVLQQKDEEFDGLSEEKNQLEACIIQFFIMHWHDCPRFARSSYIAHGPSRKRYKACAKSILHLCPLPLRTLPPWNVHICNWTESRLATQSCKRSTLNSNAQTRTSSVSSING